jgi:hypothetical protein
MGSIPIACSNAAVVQQAGWPARTRHSTCGDCKAAGSPTKSHGGERYPDPVPTDSTTVVQLPDERQVLVRFQLGGLWPKSK